MLEHPIRRIEAFVFRWPVATPVRTSFGVMHDRPAVFVRLEDSDGAVGWGEIWCNFPVVGAEHRARLVKEVLAPLLGNRTFSSPRAAFDELSHRVSILALQSGEHGPLAQSIAGLDIALWDLAAPSWGAALALSWGQRPTSRSLCQRYQSGRPGGHGRDPEGAGPSGVQAESRLR
jgi:D-galactarolactone cycloisomerase